MPAEVTPPHCSQESEYIITGTMLAQWRSGCVLVSAPRQYDDTKCSHCEFQGNGARKGCCDFSDDDMEKIFRSRPVPSQEASPALAEHLRDAIDIRDTTIRLLEKFPDDFALKLSLKQIVEEIANRAPKFNSTDLLLLAHDEWKRREERKHIHEEPAWVSGFINGFCTQKQWAARHIAATLREQAQQPERERR